MPNAWLHASDNFAFCIKVIRLVTIVNSEFILDSSRLRDTSKAERGELSLTSSPLHIRLKCRMEGDLSLVVYSSLARVFFRKVAGNRVNTLRWEYGDGQTPADGGMSEEKSACGTSP